MKEKSNLPPLDASLSKGLYTACYYLAFGAVFVGHVAYEMLPEDSMVRHGIRDGADAARKRAAERRREDVQAEEEMAIPPS